MQIVFAYPPHLPTGSWTFVWAPTLFYTKTCNFLKESNFFSRLQIFLKLESIQDNHSINNLIYYIFFNILLALRILFAKYI